MNRKNKSGFCNFSLTTAFLPSATPSIEFFFYKPVWINGFTVNATVTLTFGGYVSFGNYSNNTIIQSTVVSGSGSYNVGLINISIITNFNQVFRFQKPINTVYLKLGLNSTLGAGNTVNFNVEVSL